MPEARRARQQDVCPWQRLALVRIMFGISCTGERERDRHHIVKAYLQRRFAWK